MLVAQAVTSCGDDSGGGGCEPGEINTACFCSADEMGEQVCQADRTYTECDCDGPGGNGGDGGSAGSSSMAGSAGAAGGTPDPIIPAGLIGAPCTSDADCSDAVDNFKCILETSNVEFDGLGGPEGGYCTVPCSGTPDCSALDGASACGLFDDATGQGYCLALCLAGNNPEKCGDGGTDFRAQACVENPNAAPVGVCFPFCTSDEACGPGRFCALGGAAAGLCVDEAPVGGGIGAACDPNGMGEECASEICLTFSQGGVPVGAFCSASCTYAAQFGCGYAPGTPATTPRDAFCLQEQLDGGQPGDLGFCFELCDVDADCVQQDWVCDSFPREELQTLLGREGQCVPAVLSNDVVVDAGPG